LRAQNSDLNINATDANMSFDKQKLLISQLGNMKMELEEELNASEENREILKADLEDANSKIVDLEEDLFESKTI